MCQSQLIISALNIITIIRLITVKKGRSFWWMIQEHFFAQLSQAVHSSKADWLKKHFFLVSSALIGRLNFKHRRSYIHTASQASKTTEKWPKISILVEWTYKQSPSQFVNKEASAPKMEENKKMCEVRHTPNFKPKQLPSLTKYICYEVSAVCTRMTKNMVYNALKFAGTKTKL